MPKWIPWFYAINSFQACSRNQSLIGDSFPCAWSAGISAFLHTAFLIAPSCSKGLQESIKKRAGDGVWRQKMLQGACGCQELEVWCQSADKLRPCKGDFPAGRQMAWDDVALLLLMPHSCFHVLLWWFLFEVSEYHCTAEIERRILYPSKTTVGSHNESPRLEIKNGEIWAHTDGVQVV